MVFKPISHHPTQQATKSAANILTREVVFNCSVDQYTRGTNSTVGVISAGGIACSCPACRTGDHMTLNHGS